ncbi:MAG: T9SS type A sorting domain-containing protein [Crocinitomix sp.]|nr:T9SS type A sorting domain-containing protein [Crocinitomix sp.]
MKQLFIIIFSIQPLSSFGQIILNEAQSANNSTIADTAGEFDDWIELYNPSSDSVEIGGLILKDQLDTWAIPTGDPSTLIAPGEFFLLWADDQEFQGDFHTNFKLASGGEFLGLYEADGVTVIDTITLVSIEADESYEKCNDGWEVTNEPSPLAINNCLVGIQNYGNANDLVDISLINSDLLDITLLSDFSDQITLHIYSLDGKLVIRESVVDQRTEVDLSTLKSNLYIVSISTADFYYSTKIVLP